MVSGETQCIDSALIKANASLDSLLEKQPSEDSPSPPSLKVVATDAQGQEQGPKGPAKFDRSTPQQRIISAPDLELAKINQRQKHWAQTQQKRPHIERAKYLSKLITPQLTLMQGR